jgi:hypothetical protein
LTTIYTEAIDLHRIEKIRLTIDGIKVYLLMRRVPSKVKRSSKTSTNARTMPTY